MTRRHARGVAAVTACLAMLNAGRASAQPPFPAEPRRPVMATVPAWPRLDVSEPVARRAARRALDEAWQLLGQSTCGALLTGYHDSAGRPLQASLEQLSVDPQTYLTLVVFVDGTRERACSEGVLAVTTPGSRVVRLCAGELTRSSQRSPQYVTASFIHEMLHTLGLRENPPSPKEITQRVLAACYRDR